MKQNVVARSDHNPPLSYLLPPFRSVHNAARRKRRGRI